MRLKSLEDETDDMEKENGLYFVPGLDFRHIQNHLQENRSDKKEVVPGDAEQREIFRCKKQKEKRASKDTRLRFFQAEYNKFVQSCSNFLHTVPRERFELSIPCENCVLNAARLPISPPRRPWIMRSDRWIFKCFHHPNT